MADFDIFLNAVDITQQEIKREVDEVIKIPGKGLFKFDGVKWNKVDYTDEMVTNYIPTGNEGQISFVAEDGVSLRENDWLIKLGNFIDDPDTFEEVKNETISQEEVFNSWYRFSHNGDGNYPSNADETEAWVLNDDGTISCTKNTTTYVGFVSNNTYDYYDLEVTLSSTDGDNDRMGVVLAFYKDLETGKEYTIDAIRNNETDGYSWTVILNYDNYSGDDEVWENSQKIIGNKSDVIPRADPDNWSKYSPGTVIKVQREGNNFKVWSSLSGSSAIDENSLIEFSLDDDPAFDVFKGPKAYGFSSRSQNNTTFSNIKFKNTSPIAVDNYVFDIQNNKVYDKNIGDYIDNDIFEIIGKGRIVKDITTGKMWFLGPDKNLHLITSVDDVEKYYFSKLETLELMRELLKYVFSDGANADGVDSVIDDLITSVNNGEL